MEVFEGIGVIKSISDFVGDAAFLLKHMIEFVSGGFVKKVSDFQFARYLSFVKDKQLEVILPVWQVAPNETDQQDKKLQADNPQEKDKKPEVIIPVWKIDSNEHKQTYVTFEESKSLDEIRHIIDVLPDENKNIDYHSPKKDYSGANNAFLLGDIYTNPKIAKAFRDNINRVTFAVPVSTYDNNPDLKDLLCPGDTASLLIDGQAYLSHNPAKEGYAIWIKLTGKKDFGTKDHGTTHICIGSGPFTVWKVIRCYNSRRNTMLKKMSLHKDHYFLAALCDSDGNPRMDTIEDLTEKVF